MGENGAGRKYSYHVEAKALEIEDRPRKFLEAFAAALEHSNYGPVVDAFARLCSRCGRCAPACPLYPETAEDRDIPAFRSHMLLDIYRRYFTSGGAFKAGLFGGFELTDGYLDEMAEAFYRCTACRRCQKVCPFGIDHGFLTHFGRWLLSEVGIVPKALVVATRQQLEGVGNTSGIPLPAMKDTLEFLEEDFEETHGYKISFPIDKDGAEHVFFTAVSDYLLDPDALSGMCAVFQMAGVSWTIGSGNFDGINYGLFYSDRIMERIVGNMIRECKRLDAEKVVMGECGHATRSAWFGPTFGKGDAPSVTHSLEIAWKAIQEGKIPLKRGAIEERVTYHDPCNIARNGKITEPPREILKMICADYVEMTPNREMNYCCGGGGGLVSLDEMREFRTRQMGKIKADQIRATGAKLVIAPCANCKKQLNEVIEDNGLEGVEAKGMFEILVRAIDFEELARRNGSVAPVASETAEAE